MLTIIHNIREALIYNNIYLYKREKKDKGAQKAPIKNHILFFDFNIENLVFIFFIM